MDADAVLYVHVAWGGMLLYSREAPDRDPPEIVTRTFELIGQAGLPIKLLEEPHPSVSGPSPHGMTTLMGAGHGDNAELVEALLSHGADPNAADKEASTPVMFAAQHGTPRSFGLLDAGADLGARGDHGLTALGFARQNGHGETAALLEAAGAPG